MDKVTIELDAFDFYSVINALRDVCRCDDCYRISNDLMAQRLAQHEKEEGSTHVNYLR